MEVRDAPGPASAQESTCLSLPSVGVHLSPASLVGRVKPPFPLQRPSVSEDLSPGNDADPAHCHVPGGSIGVHAGEFKPAV